MKNSKYIGLGYCLEYIIKSKLKKLYALIDDADILKLSPKISFIITTDNGLKIAISAHNTSLDNIKISNFFNHKNNLNHIDKFLYIHYNISINDNDHNNEELLISNLIDNFINAINEVQNSDKNLFIYSISAYDAKELTTSNLPIIDYANTNKKELDIFDESERSAKIIRIKNKMIVILLESGTTHIGVIDYKAENRQNIISFIEGVEKDVQGNLLKPILCTVIMEPNKEFNRPYMAKVIRLNLD